MLSFVYTADTIVVLNGEKSGQKMALAATVIDVMCR